VPAYVDSVFSRAPEHGLSRLDQDTVVGPHSLDAALRAAGAVVAATDLVLKGHTPRAFCNVRPPGHHAERGRAMGFCLFDNVAVGLAHALEVHGLKRVAVVDFDVHHGNGTEDILSPDGPYAERVLFCSSFEHPLYPGTGADTCSEHILNVPLSAGTTGAGFRSAVAAAWFEPLAAFAPEMVFFSAGFDAHVDDPLANLSLEAEDYAWITAEVRRATDAHTGGRIVSSLEGGYALDALGASAAAHVGELLV
jgi:acetoin utilization deacetylase AcuC-like enzyme